MSQLTTRLAHLERRTLPGSAGTDAKERVLARIEALAVHLEQRATPPGPMASAVERMVWDALQEARIAANPSQAFWRAIGHILRQRAAAVGG